MKKRLLGAGLGVLLSACVSQSIPAGPAVQQPVLAETHWQTADGVRLPLRRWLPDTAPKAVLLALHGMNDYSNFFDEQGKWLAQRGIASFAYDQRGFGAAPQAGYWSSTDSMVHDAEDLTRLLAAAYPGRPLVLFGESMGGAITMICAARTPDLPVRGVILSAPAVWGRASMKWYHRVSLWLTYHLVPGLPLTGQGLGIRPSDNMEMLRALSADPLVIKETRVDAIKGVVDVMDEAAASARHVHQPALILYGDKDEIIPKAPVQTMLEALPGLGQHQKVMHYPNGYHMLTRDLQAEVVLKDMAVWLTGETP